MLLSTSILVILFLLFTLKNTTPTRSCHTTSHITLKITATHNVLCLKINQVIYRLLLQNNKVTVIINPAPYTSIPIITDSMQLISTAKLIKHHNKYFSLGTLHIYNRNQIVATNTSIMHRA